MEPSQALTRVPHGTILDDAESFTLCDELLQRIQDHTTRPPGGEQYRLIRTRLIHHPIQPKCVLISSPGIGDGKTMTAVNLSWVLALREGARTLLIDADLRRCSVGNHFGLHARLGFAEVLRGETTLKGTLQTCTQNPNLYVLGGGMRRNNVTELLDTPQCQEWMANIRTLFDYVVLDAPPVATVADYELLARHVDGVILIVRPNHTNRRVVKATFASVPQDSLIGVVINYAREWPFWRTPHGYYGYSERSR